MEWEEQDAPHAQEEGLAPEGIEAEEVPEEERWAIACIQQMF